MSSSIFMRGGTYDSSLLYYLAYTSSTNAYVFSMNTGNYTSNGITPTAGFLQVTDQYSDYSIVEFIISPLGNNTYSFQSGSLFLGLNVNGIIDLVSDISEALLFSAPTNSTMNIYDLQNVLYPGIPYSISIDGTVYKWYVFTPTTTSSWEYYTITTPSTVPTPFLVQVNTSTNPLAVWQTTDDYPDGQCFYSPNTSSIGIGWLYDWTQGTSTNCETVGSLNSSYNNCYFSSLLSCEIAYSYNFCTGSTTCGTCMGTTTSPDTLQCRNNLPGSSIPLFQSSTSITYASSISNAVELEEESDNSCSTTSLALFILILIVFFVVVVIIVLIMKSNDKDNKKSSTTSVKTSYNY